MPAITAATASQLALILIGTSFLARARSAREEAIGFQYCGCVTRKMDTAFMCANTAVPNKRELKA
jgi:hypothetical protein